MDAVLAHFHDDDRLHVAVRRPTSSASATTRWRRPRSKRRRANAGARALQATPDLHFDIVGVYGGASVLVTNYRNQGGTLVNEVLEIDGRAGAPRTRDVSGA